MTFSFRFAIISDPHIALPHTISDHPSRFHIEEVSIPAFEVVLAELEAQNLDFLLIPGDLTQHGEPENHQWLSDRLAQLPYPVYVVPGNHDVPALEGSDPIDSQFPGAIGLSDFPTYYPSHGYSDPSQPYYSHVILPGVRLIGLQSNQFDAEGKQLGMGELDEAQLTWLRQVLDHASEPTILVMLHHNVIEHLPGQSRNPMGQRYMLKNAPVLLELLQRYGVQILLTGHLHVQDVAQHQGIYEITTGSLVSYPHPYRVLEFHRDEAGQTQLRIESGRVTSVPGWLNLPHLSREWMGDRSLPFMLKLLTLPPLSLSLTEAEQLAPSLRYFWADIANGDATFHFPQFPPSVNRYFSLFNAQSPIDNASTLHLNQR